MQVPGVLDRVTYEQSGSALVADAASGATTLLVDWHAEFSSQGVPGKLEVGGTTYTYTAVDSVANSLTLATGLTAAASTDDPVHSLTPAGEERGELKAYVRTLQDADSVPYGVNTPGAAFLTTATPSGTDVLVDDSERQVVGRPDIPTGADLTGAVGSLGSGVDVSGATGLPAAGPTAAPTSVPTPAVYADSGQVCITWTPLVDSFTRLRLYVTNANSDGTLNSSAPKDGTTLFASDVKPPLFISALSPGGTPLDPSKKYQFALGSYNAIGDGPYSAWVLGQPGTIFNLLIAQTAIINALQAATIDSVNFRGGSISIATATSGTENFEFSGTSWPSGLNHTVYTNGAAARATMDVVSTGAPSGVDGSAIQFASVANTTDESPKYTDAYVSGTLAVGDFEIEVRFQYGGDSADVTAEPTFAFGGRLGSGSLPAVGVPSVGIGIRFYRRTIGDFYVVNVNGSGTTVISRPVDPTNSAARLTSGWYRARLKVTGGTIESEVRPETVAAGTSISTASASASLAKGPMYVTYSQLHGPTQPNRQVWVDWIHTTGYTTGFQVLPDATGDWPYALDPIRAVTTPAAAAWASYTPTWTAVTANPSLGNGTLVGRYRQVGKTVDFITTLTWGSSTTGGTSRWQFTLPVAPLNADRRSFNVETYDVSATSPFVARAIWTSGTSKIECYCSPTTAGATDRNVSAANPFTWASGDQLVITGSYEAA